MRKAIFMTVVAGVMAGGGSFAMADNQSANPGRTTVLKWRDGKKAVILLAFDDACGSQIKNAIPALKKYGFVGTFYVNPEWKSFKNDFEIWKKETTDNAVAFGNHTYTHGGVTNAGHLDEELAKCNDIICGLYPERKMPRLISFAQPGGVKWQVSADEEKKALAKYNLIKRPAFHGRPAHKMGTQYVLDYIDSTIQKGEMGHIDFHGVGGDWLSAPLDEFNAMIEKLDACKDAIWQTDHISWHKYLTERETAEVSAVKADKQKISMRLTCKADLVLYDLPLTLETAVPADWTACAVTQGKTRQDVKAENGVIRYSATPGAEEITIIATK